MLETERLLLRRPRPDDVEAARLFERDLAAWLEQWELHGVGTFLVERRADGELVGRVGVKFFDGHPELGWTLLPGTRATGTRPRLHARFATGMQPNTSSR